LRPGLWFNLLLWSWSALLLAQRLGNYHVLWVPAVRLGIGTPVDLGSLHVLCLELGWSHVLLVLGSPLLGGGGVLNATRTAAIGNAVRVDDCVSLHNRPINVGGVDDVLIYAHDRGVIGKLATAPLATGKADALVAEAVVHATVVAHVAAPVAPVESVAATVPIPVVGRPERALIGSLYPGAGDPVVIPVTPSPVAGHPHKVGLGADRLLIDG
jgi:hypothetical protein